MTEVLPRPVNIRKSPIRDRLPQELAQGSPALFHAELQQPLGGHKRSHGVRVADVGGLANLQHPLKGIGSRRKAAKGVGPTEKNENGVLLEKLRRVVLPDRQRVPDRTLDPALRPSWMGGQNHLHLREGRGHGGGDVNEGVVRRGVEAKSRDHLHLEV
eukprot:UN4864